MLLASVFSINTFPMAQPIYPCRKQGYNKKMSKIQAYKYSFIRRPLLPHPTHAHNGDHPQVLKQKMDYANRLLPTSAIKNTDKTLIEEEKGHLEPKQQLIIGEVRQEASRERRALDAPNQQLLTEIVDLFTALMRHPAALEEYLRLQRRGSENCNRDLQREYRIAKEKFDTHRRHHPITTFAILKKSLINPERDTQNALTIKRVVQVKIPPISILNFSHQTPRNDTRPWSEKVRRGSMGLARSEIASTPLHLVNEKYRHCQEKARKLEQALGHEVALRAQNELMIQQLNQRVISGQMEVLNAKMKARSSGFYC